jgi:uncharacterized protein YqjF (DUF2071 family)
VDLPTQRLLQVRSRPDRRPLLYQNWDDLFFLHWEYNAALLQQRLPQGLTVDCFEGRAHLAVVGFRMNRVRPPGLPPLPWLSSFNELNVRTYVRSASGEPGVYFFSLDCDRSPAVIIARRFFGLLYEHAVMSWGPGRSLLCRRKDQPAQARYVWSPASNPHPTTPGSLEFHLTERYQFFSEKNGRICRGRVHHAPYRLSTANLTEWSALPILWDGFDLLQRPPDLAHCCSGVSIEAFALEDGL